MAAAETVVLDALVARVNGQPITWSQVVRETEIRRLSGEPPSLQHPMLVREGLIRRRLLLFEAEKLRLEADPAELDRSLADLTDRSGGKARFEIHLRKLGGTPARLRERARQMVLVEKYRALRRETTFVAEAEVQRFYRSQRDVFGPDRGTAEVRDEIRDYLARKKYQKALDGWLDDQVAAGRVELMTLPVALEP